MRLLEGLDLLAHARRDLAEQLDVQAHAGQLHRAQDAHERQLDVAHHAVEPQLLELLALPARERAHQQRIAGLRLLEVGVQPAVLAQLAQRVAAARGIEQVGAEERVVREPLRDQAEVLRVVRDDRARAARRRDFRGVLAGAAQDLAALAADDREAPGGLLAEERSLRHLRRQRRDVELVTADPGDVLDAPHAHARRERLRGAARAQPLAGLGIGAGERLFEPLQRRAHLVLAEDLHEAAQVGLAGERGAHVHVDRQVPAHRRELLGEPRVLCCARSGSACASRR